MSQQNELRVFISSTFRDLQEEREYLVKKIFPEIRSLCRRRGVTFTDVDLRWGITEEEAEREGIIRICLDEIDRCRPYFIGILGERYGWTPSPLDAERVKEEFPSVADAIAASASITEMEIVHGVLDNPAMAGHAFFYFRNHDSTPAEFIDTDPDIAGRLHDLKNRIREGGFPVREDFTSPVELGTWLEEDLRRAVDANHPESEAPSALELERRAQRAFAASRTRAYIANPEYLRQFKEFINRQSAIENCLVLTGASGLGKSSLVAHLVDDYRTNHPTAFVIEHYIGASQASGSATAIMRHIVEEIRERFGITDELPAKPKELEKSFPNWLFRGEHYAKQSDTAMLIVIDAVNQLDESDRRLVWLPKTIPAGIQLLVSTTPGECAEHLAERAWATLEVVPIDDDETRRQIVHRYLGEFRKSITTEQTRRLITDVKASSPLYLRVVSEELRLHGEHETLDSVIDRYVSAADLLDVFDRVLERLEHDYGVAPVERMMSVIWASRSGLSETELMALADLSRIDLSRLLFAIDYHFLHREGLLGFFHDYLRRAVEKRYLEDAARRNQIRTELVRYFEGVALTERAALELLWQYGADGEAGGATERDERLATTLARADVLMLLYRGETCYEMLERWTQLSGRGHKAEEYYRRSLAVKDSEERPKRGDVLKAGARLLASMSQWGGAEELYEELVAWGREHEQRAEEVQGYLGLGWIMQARGEYTGAMEQCEEGLRLATELGDRSGMSYAIGYMGNVHRNQGRYTEAMECFSRQLAICEELGHHSGMSNAIGYMGIVHWNQGRYTEALECYSRQLAIYEELGERLGMSYAIGNMGLVHLDQGRYAEAMECYGRQLAISEELGDRRGMSYAIGNMGGVHGSQGRYTEAMECYSRKLAISEELGDRSGIAWAIGNMGNVHLDQGRYTEAMECYSRHLTICEELGDRSGMSSAIGNMGIIHSAQGRYTEAMECYSRKLAICEELGDRSGMPNAIGNMGFVHAERGEYDRALECYAQATERHRVIGFRAGLTVWLAGTAETLLKLLDQAAGEMPEYLLAWLPGATEETWYTLALQHARECAKECVAISDDISKPDTQFSGRVLLGRVEAAKGRGDVAIEQLVAMLAEAREDSQQAELHYWLWKLGASGHAAAALGLYQALYARTPKHDYRKRIDELSETTNPPEATDAPE